MKELVTLTSVVLIVLALGMIILIERARIEPNREVHPISVYSQPR
jgi:hypothetical protein